MKKPQKALVKLVFIIFLAAQFYGFGLLFPKKLDSANLTSVSDTLSNNRLSFRGELEGAHAAGAGVITLDTSPENSNNTSTDSGTLMLNDSIRIGSAGSTATVTTVKTIESTTRVFLGGTLANAVNDADPVIATAAAIHTVRFTTATTVPNGVFRALLQSSSTTTKSGDGLPDADGFDLGALPTVSCSTTNSNFNFAAGTATVAAYTVSSINYHSFECQYGGAGAASAAITMTIGTAAGNKVINPSPSGYSASHAPGAGDTYLFRVRQLDSAANSFAQVDETIGRVSVIEAVRVTATVSPTLTFMLTGVTTSQTPCGAGSSTDVATAPNLVPFGGVLTTQWYDAAQILSVSTNSVSGYTVTASESAALTALSLTGTPTIPDKVGGSPTTLSDWTAYTTRGFGYALNDLTGDPVSTYPGGSLLYTNGGTFMSRQFGSTAQGIMYSAAGVDLDQAYVCYRISVSGSQQAGDYENYVIYIATATF